VADAGGTYNGGAFVATATVADFTRGCRRRSAMMSTWRDPSW